jgi:hypothetical protein
MTSIVVETAGLAHLGNDEGERVRESDVMNERRDCAGAGQ